jgi:hypothetical protein
MGPDGQQDDDRSTAEPEGSGLAVSEELDDTNLGVCRRRALRGSTIRASAPRPVTRLERN